jgi:hypothetical protein
MNCPTCQSEIPANARFCAQCGHAVSGPSKTPRWAIILAALVIPLAGYFIYNQFSVSGTTPNKPSIISAAFAVPHSVQIGDGSLSVGAVGLSYYQIPVPPGAMEVQISGRFVATGGLGNDIDAYVMAEDDFVNFKNGHNAQSFYASGKVTRGSISARLPNGAGTYYLVFDNRFSLLTPKAVSYNATLTYMQ